MQMTDTRGSARRRALQRWLLPVVAFGSMMAGCDSGDTQRSESSGTSVSAEDVVSARPGPLDVTITEAAFVCGPTDLTEIGFTVLSNQQFEASAILQVGGPMVAISEHSQSSSARSPMCSSSHSIDSRSRPGRENSRSSRHQTTRSSRTLTSSATKEVDPFNAHPILVAGTG